MKLKSTITPPPGGFKFYQPQLKWRGESPDFGTLCLALLEERRRRQDISRRHHLSLTIDGVQADVEDYNAKLLFIANLKDFIADNVEEYEAPFINERQIVRPKLRKCCGRK